MTNSIGLQKIVREGYLFQPVDYISRGFSLFKAQPWLFIFFGLVAIGLGGALESVIYTLDDQDDWGLVAIGLGGALEKLPIPESFLKPFLLVLQFVGPFVLLPVMRIGFFVAGRNLDTGQKASVGNLFEGFSKVGLLAATEILTILACFIAAIPGLLIALLGIDFSLLSEVVTSFPEVDSFLHRPVLFWTGLAIASLMAFFCYVFLLWASPLVYFFNMDPFQGLQSSAGLVRNAWKQVSYFLTLLCVVAFGGILFFVVGILVSLPAMGLADYSAFAAVTGLNIEDDEWDRGLDDSVG